MFFVEKMRKLLFFAQKSSRALAYVKKLLYLCSRFIMRKCVWNILLLLGLMLSVSSCKITRFVGEDEYLLNKARVKVVDTKDVEGSNLRNYLRQKQNTEILGFWKLQLQIYNTAPADTTTKSKKWLAKNAHKMGEEPVIYDEMLTAVSMEQLTKAMNNRGYFNASVDTIVKRKNKKIDLTYEVTARQPYVLNSYSTDLDNAILREHAARGERVLDKGDIFNSDRLDEERQRVATLMRNDGYYFFEKSLLKFEADSSYQNHEVAVDLMEQDFIAYLPDSTRHKIYSRYYIRHVSFHMDDERLLRERVLRNHTAIRSGDLFDERNVERTYAELNGLGPIKYVDIAFDPVPGVDSLDCRITISRAKLNTVSAEVEGTYSAGDWGVAAGVGYQNKNIFHGAELLTLRGRGSYEWRQNGGRAIEANAEAGLQFPTNVRLNIAYNYQTRPNEYSRTIANAGVYYTIKNKNLNSHWTHTFNLIDISYIYLPWMSEQFRTDFLEKSSVLRTSYEDHFILDWSYRGSYTGYDAKKPNKSFVNFSYSIETAGNLLYAISKMAGQKKNEQGQYEIFHIPYSQYAKADLNFAFHQVLVPNHKLVYHAALGVACPFLNASTIPFEKRYFSGGSNSVRGWQARTLGPGAFRGNGNALVYDLQAGDIRLDLNLEYRWKCWTYLELAAFVDAGNIWTIRDYEQQPHGVFKWNEFYKQLALSYGVGVRIDAQVVIFRVDLGVKLHDPTRMYGALAGTEWRTVPHGLCWRDDFTLHFAIGYPF